MVFANRRLCINTAKSRMDLDPKVSVPTLDDFKITDSNATIAVFPRRGEIPAGEYTATIVGVEVELTARQEVALVIQYRLDGDNGRSYYILQKHPKGSRPLCEFNRAMINAGVPVGSEPTKTIGVQEIVYLYYISEKTDIGCFVARQPLKNETMVDTDDDEDELWMNEE